MQMTGRKANRAELAALFGVAVTTVDHWVRAGCPFDQRAEPGREWIFDTADVARWREKRAAEHAAGTAVQDEAELRLRKLNAETMTVELELQKARALLAPVAEIESAWEKAKAEIQSRLRGVLVSRLASRLIGETNERAFKRIAIAEIDAVLTSLADTEVFPEESESPIHMRE